MRKLVGVLDFATEEEKNMIRKTAEECGFSAEFYDVPEEADGKVSDCEVLLCRTPQLIPQAKKAKWIASSNAGVDPYLKPGVMTDDSQILTNSAGAYGVTISEHIIMVTLMLLKRLPEYQEYMEKKEWKGGLNIRSMKGSRVTILGTGDIGKETAARMDAMGASEITGLNHSGHPAGEPFTRTDASSQIDRYLPETDILVCCVPDTPETRGLIGKKQLQELPETAYLINVGRGSLIDQDALVDALNHREIAGAALDVMTPEPLPEDNPLWDAENCILTPHISGNMTLGYTVHRCIELFCDNLRRYAAGEPMHNIVDRKRGY
jgi:phosphoglycerate dehydrogenase-like enzyme